MKHKELFLFAIVHLIDLPITYYNVYFKSGILEEDSFVVRHLISLNLTGWIIWILLKLIVLAAAIHIFIYWKKRHAKSYWIFFIILIVIYSLVLINTFV